MITRFLVAFVGLYQRYISPLTGPSCGYYPTCSTYAAQALQTHGALRGSWLSLRRLGRCNPWTRGGVDMVPDRAHYRWWGISPTPDASDQRSPGGPPAPKTDAGA